MSIPTYKIRTSCQEKNDRLGWKDGLAVEAMEALPKVAERARVVKGKRATPEELVRYASRHLGRLTPSAAR